MTQKSSHKKKTLKTIEKKLRNGKSNDFRSKFLSPQFLFVFARHNFFFHILFFLYRHNFLYLVFVWFHFRCARMCPMKPNAMLLNVFECVRKYVCVYKNWWRRRRWYRYNYRNCFTCFGSSSPTLSPPLSLSVFICRSTTVYACVYFICLKYVIIMLGENFLSKVSM